MGTQFGHFRTTPSFGENTRTNESETCPPQFSHDGIYPIAPPGESC